MQEQIAGFHTNAFPANTHTITCVHTYYQTQANVNAMQAERVHRDLIAGLANQARTGRALHPASPIGRHTVLQ